MEVEAIRGSLQSAEGGTFFIAADDHSRNAKLERIAAVAQKRPMQRQLQRGPTRKGPVGGNQNTAGTDVHAAGSSFVYGQAPVDQPILSS